MGWIRCDGQEHSSDHEGYIVGVVRDGTGWRELRYGDEAVDIVEYVQVACECGWRSPRMIAPLGTYFAPATVGFKPIGGGHGEEYHDAAGDIWDAHMDAVTATTRQELLDRARSLTASR